MSNCPLRLSHRKGSWVSFPSTFGIFQVAVPCNYFLSRPVKWTNEHFPNETSWWSLWMVRASKTFRQRDFPSGLSQLVVARTTRLFNWTFPVTQTGCRLNAQGPLNQMWWSCNIRMSIYRVRNTRQGGQYKRIVKWSICDVYRSMACLTKKMLPNFLL